MHRFSAGVVLAFSCWHAAFLAGSIVPRHEGQETAGTPAMDVYRAFTGSRQIWNMFDTIPLLHSLDVRLEGPGPAGKTMSTGPVLPGFAPYPQPEESRYYALFHRLLFTKDGDAFRAPYLRKAAQLSQPDRTITTDDHGWVLIMDAAITRNLFHSRRDGQIALPVEKKYGPVATPGVAPATAQGAAQ